MTFLQPYLLWGLPLVLVPVLIHLLNRMRYRSMPWGAMMFLVQASRHSVRHARLRHWLLLLCRALAVAALIVALARPLVGGWLGWALQAAPDTILVLLDRSASMERSDPVSQTPKRVLALQRLADAAKTFGGAPRLVLIDSALRLPQELSSPGLLPELTAAGPTDTAADLPALLAAAVDYIAANRCGKTEIWIASDLQASNWQPKNPQWPALATRIASLPQDVRVRLLALGAPAPDNAGVAVSEIRRQKTGAESELFLTIDLERTAADRVTLPLSIGLEGGRSMVNVTMPGQNLRLQHQINLGTRAGGGWGKVELPPDANDRDNVAYFAYGEEVHHKGVVVSDDDAVGRYLSLAVAPAPELIGQSCRRVASAEARTLKLDDVALVIWQAPTPAGGLPEPLRRYVAAGGQLIFFPPGPDGTRSAGEFAWGAVDQAETDKPFRINRWQNSDGPLAQTRDGTELPVGELKILKRQPFTGDATVLAAFEDGQPFLARRHLDKGAVYFCATLPGGRWSTLGEGPVLVPMLQRLLAAGGRRFGSATQIFCGDPPPPGVDPQSTWVRLDRAPAKDRSDWRTQAGVYQAGNRIVAVNRPPAEDQTEIADEATVRSLFGAVPFRLFEEPDRQAGGNLQSEIWRAFLWAMLVLLLAEPLLAMPERTRLGNDASSGHAEAWPSKDERMEGRAPARPIPMDAVVRGSPDPAPVADRRSPAPDGRPAVSATARSGDPRRPPGGGSR